MLDQVKSAENVQPTSTVLMHISMLLADGSAVDSTKVHNKPMYVQLGDDSLSSAFETEILGLSVGDKKKFSLSAEDSYGAHDPSLLVPMSPQSFQEDNLKIEKDMVMAFTQPNGQELPGLIRSVTEKEVLVDFNHPLAGQAVTFDVEVLAIEDRG